MKLQRHRIQREKTVNLRMMEEEGVGSAQLQGIYSLLCVTRAGVFGVANNQPICCRQSFTRVVMRAKIQVQVDAAEQRGTVMFGPLYQHHRRLRHISC